MSNQHNIESTGAVGAVGDVLRASVPTAHPVHPQHPIHPQPQSQPPQPPQPQSSFEVTVVNLLQQLVVLTSGLLAGLKALTVATASNMPLIDVNVLKQLLTIVVQLIQAKSDDDTQITALNAQLADLTAQAGALSDPALATQLSDLVTAATNAVANPNAPPPTPDPNAPQVNPESSK